MIIEKLIDKIESNIKNVIPNTDIFGEVYTPLSMVETMLSIIDDDFFTNPNLKILDPCCGFGNFSVILIKRFMKGLSFINNESERYNHIINNMIYVCDIQERNIELYKSIFNTEKNVYCGSFLDECYNDIIFDLVIGNPPYQKGTNSRNSVSIYHKFVEKSVNIGNSVLMITPSKWYSNPSMKIFRNNMIYNYGLKILNDVESNVFETVDIKGGVSYFLLEKGFINKCLYNGIETIFNDIITDKHYDNIEDNYSKYLFNDQYFDIKNKDERFLKEKEVDTVKCYVSLNNGGEVYIKRNLLKNKENINKWKVLIPTASGSKKDIGVLGRMIIAKPDEVCSRSFVHFCFDTEIECINFVEYLNSDFAKNVIKLKKQTQLVKKDTFSLLPVIKLF